MRVSPKDTMKRKQFIKGTEQIAQEGAIQIFKMPGAGHGGSHCGRGGHAAVRCV